MSISFFSSFTMQNGCTMAFDCFLITHWAIFSLNNWEENHFILSPHCPAVVPQLTLDE